MDHIVYVDAQAGEMEQLLDGTKTTIVRGAAGRKAPYRRVRPGDVLFFVRNNGEGAVAARATVRSVYDSDPLAPHQALRMLQSRQCKAQLSDGQMKRWACKRYLVFVEVENVQPVEPCRFNGCAHENMDDWVVVGAFEEVRRA